MNEQVRHRAVQALEGEPGKVARAGASEHFHFLSVLAGTYDDTVRNIDIGRVGYLRHSFIAGFPTERVPKMPWGWEGTAGCPAASAIVGGCPPALPRRWGPRPAPRSGDEAVTSGDMLGGLEFAGFPGRKRKPEQSGRLEPAFDRKPAKLEAQPSHSPSDTEKRTLRTRPFWALFAPKTEPDGAVTSTRSGTGAAFAHFCTQKASGDKAVTSGDEFSGLEFAGFSGQKTEFGARRTSGAGFRRKTSELGGSGTTFDV